MSTTQRLKGKRSPSSLAPPAQRAAAAVGGAQAAGRAAARPGNLDRKITFRLDDERMADLENFARSEGGTVSFVVRRLVISFLDGRLR